MTAFAPIAPISFSSLRDKVPFLRKKADAAAATLPAGDTAASTGDTVVLDEAAVAAAAQEREAIIKLLTPPEGTENDDEWEWVTDAETPPLPNEAFIQNAAPSLLEAFVVKPYKYKRMSPGIFLDHLPSPAGPEDPIVQGASHRNRSFVVTLSGKVFSRGMGLVGQLGIGNVPYARNYTEIKGLPPVRKVITCPQYTLFLTCDGLIYYTGAWHVLDWLRPSARRPRYAVGAGPPSTAAITDVSANRLSVQLLTEDGMIYRWATNPLTTWQAALRTPTLVRWGTTQAEIDAKARQEAQARADKAKVDADAEARAQRKASKATSGSAGAGSAAGAGTGAAEGAASGAGAEANAAGEGAAAATDGTGDGGADGDGLTDAARAYARGKYPKKQKDKAVRLMYAGKHHQGFISEDNRLFLWGLNHRAQFGFVTDTTGSGRKQQIWHALDPVACKATATAGQYLAGAHSHATISAGTDNNLVKFGTGRSMPPMNKFLRGMEPPLKDLAIGEDNTLFIANDGSLYSIASYELTDPIGYPGFGSDASARYGRIVALGQGRDPLLVVECNPAYKKYVLAAKDKHEKLAEKLKTEKGRQLERAYAPNQELPENNPNKGPDEPGM
jgi:alpha-tubulin suppressor-like RCC1 family protein